MFTYILFSFVEKHNWKFIHSFIHPSFQATTPIIFNFVERKRQLKYHHTHTQRRTQCSNNGRMGSIIHKMFMSNVEQLWGMLVNAVQCFAKYNVLFCDFKITANGPTFEKEPNQPSNEQQQQQPHVAQKSLTCWVKKWAENYDRFAIMGTLQHLKPIVPEKIMHLVHFLLEGLIG